MTAGPDDLTPPAEVFAVLAAAQAARWGYDKTLDGEELAAYLRGRIEDGNVRADVDAVWRHAAYHFTGQAGGGPL